MKGMLILLALLLSGCQATMISYNSARTGVCPPVVQVQSFGSSVVIADGSECGKDK